MNKKPIYKTWIRLKKIVVFSLISVFLIVITLLPINYLLRILAGVLALPFLYITFIISYSCYQFSELGGDFQSKIHNLIIDRIKYNGNERILDIGTGSGSLIIKLAKLIPNASCVDIDYWGEEWEYSKHICETNAECEMVKDNIDFIKASASRLPFKEEFDVVVSCLTFHEVKDEDDKIKVIKEALRVVNQGGRFVFLDLFLDEKIFGENNKFFNTLNSLDILELKIEKLEDIIDLPQILLQKKVLGNAVIISGIK